MTESSSPGQRLIVLGPQRLRPILGQALAPLGDGVEVAMITAGWQDREAEDGELREQLARPAVNLELYRRAEELFAADPPLFAAHRRRQDTLREAQRIYRRRLAHCLAAARELLALDEESDLLAEARRQAIAAVRDLDAQHLETVRDIHRRFRREMRPDRRAGLRREKAAIAELLEGCGLVAIAGGHVAVLLNRLRLFDLLGLAGDRPIVAWSAGVMALAERVVVFHDSPPQGAGDAEALETGLGRIRGLQPFPHARRRLRLSDPRRVSLLARRFAPAVCIALDEGDHLSRGRDGWVAEAPARRLTDAGEVAAFSGPLEVAS